MNPEIADANKLGYVGKRPGGRDSDSWFTPPQYLDAVRAVLGRIDLDPFSSEAANLTVGAKHYFTEADNAFTKSWLATSVFMNPPYSGQLVRAAVEKFVEEFSLGHFKTGILLVNNATETRFFQLLLGSAKGVCFTNHRISFYNADGKRISSPTRGSAFFYFGPGTLSFCREFTKFGFALAL